MGTKDYLTFRKLESKGKTKIFGVVPIKNQDDVLGLIKWSCGWRQYIFELDGDNGTTIWSSGCLKQITDFINKLMIERTHSACTTLNNVSKQKDI